MLSCLVAPLAFARQTGQHFVERARFASKIDDASSKMGRFPCHQFDVTELLHAAARARAQAAASKQHNFEIEICQEIV